MNRKIRIAFLIDTINSVGGTEKQLLGLMASLSPDRFEKHLIILRPPNAYFHLDDESVCRRQIAFLAPQRAVHHRGAGARAVSEGRRTTSYRHTSWTRSSSGPLPECSQGRKIVCCRRDLGFWHSRGLIFLLRQADRFVDHFQVNSQAVGRQVANDELVDPGRIHVIYNGIDSTLFDGCTRTGGDQGPVQQAAGRDLSVGILANFNRRVKRVDLFIRAAAEVFRVVPDVRFFIAGDGHLKAELQALCRELGVGGHVEFLGAVTDIPETIRAWDIGVISSESEGFCNAILEYMASGIPVVATAVGGNTELVEESVSGYLVASGDYPAMAEKLCILLKDAGLRESMGEQGRRIVPEIRLAQGHPQLQSFYFDILGYDYESRLDHMGEPEEKPGGSAGRSECRSMSSEVDELKNPVRVRAGSLQDLCGAASGGRTGVLPEPSIVPRRFWWR